MMSVNQSIAPDSAAVVGFGRAGQAMAGYLHGCGAAVRVSDLRSYDELGEAEQALLAEYGADFEGGGHSEEFLAGAELVVVSPGVDCRHPALVQAAKRGSMIAGELAVAASEFSVPVVAVTGTNGKTTVTELIGALLKAAGKKVFVGGNIGTPVGEYLSAKEDYEIVVLEVSSFQLELCGDFTPEVGIVLNITPDHLDRHGSLDQYAAAKMNMFKPGADTRGVINGEDEWCQRFPERVADMNWARFGHDTDNDAAIDGSRIVMRNGQTYELGGSALDNLSGRLNAGAALLGVSPFDLDPSSVQQALMEFKPGAHRLQEVGCIEGVVYINDSKATNTGAVINAIEQLGDGIILIAGGRDKGDDYRLLRPSVASHVKRLILIGEAASAIGTLLGDLAPVDYSDSLENAVVQAASVGEPGDTVLLAPACASFDMFDNYLQRGDCFAEAVRALRKVPGAGPEAVQ